MGVADANEEQPHETRVWATFSPSATALAPTGLNANQFAFPLLYRCGGPIIRQVKFSALGHFNLSGKVHHPTSREGSGNKSTGLRPENRASFQVSLQYVRRQYAAGYCRTCWLRDGSLTGLLLSGEALRSGRARKERPAGWPLLTYQQGGRGPLVSSALTTRRWWPLHPSPPGMPPSWRCCILSLSAAVVDGSRPQRVVKDTHSSAPHCRKIVPACPSFDGYTMSAIADMVALATEHGGLGSPTPQILVNEVGELFRPARRNSDIPKPQLDEEPRAENPEDEGGRADVALAAASAPSELPLSSALWCCGGPPVPNSVERSHVVQFRLLLAETCEKETRSPHAHPPSRSGG